MKTNIMRIGPVLLALGLCAWCTDVSAQGTTTTTTTAVTTSNGAFTEFVPASETIVVRTETNAAPLRYVVTKQTTIVDEAGVPVAIERISPGSPLSVQYTGTGDRLIASRIVVQKAPVATTTTTTTTRALTRDEKEAVKEEVEKRKEEVEKAKEKEKERVEELKDKADDEDD